VQDEPLNSPPTDAGSTPPVTSTNISQIDSYRDGAVGEPAANPAWANDLRQLYNAVVEEPLPDSFLDLLSQLDSED
jgi:hypothetical protein